MTGLAAWIVAGVAGVAAFALFLRLRAIAVELAGRGVENEKLRGELGAAREQLEKLQARQRRSGDELADLRKRLEKAKKRASKSGEAGGRGMAPSRLHELETELEQTRQARDAAREESAGLAAELSRLRAAASAVQREQPALDNAGIEALRKRCEEAEAALGDVRPEVTKLEHANARLKGRIATQEKLYVSIRSELEVKKDRLRAQQEEIERLAALRAGLIRAQPGVEPVADDVTPVAADAAAPEAGEPAAAGGPGADPLAPETDEPPTST